tara:strand:+ start:654 stop:2159 length:1506 start_codon:yes stop_codon:yes gene_type:complete
MGGDVTGASNAAVVVGLATYPIDLAAPLAGGFLSWTGAIWIGTAITLAGDVTGSYSANTVTKLQNRTVSAAAPAATNVLAWNGAQWEPTAVAAVVSPATVAPPDIAAAGAAGVSLLYARQDHTHGVLVSPATVAPIEVRAAAVVGVSLLYARQDHVHRAATTYLSQVAPDTNIVGNRSANQSPTTAGLTGVTNLGNDTGAGTGCTASQTTIIGGVNASATASTAVVIGGSACTASGVRSVAIGGASNVAGATNVAVVGGVSNSISAASSRSVIFGGTTNTIVTDSADSIVAGGGVNTVTSSISCAIIGTENGTITGANQSAVLCGESVDITHSFAIAHGIGAASRNVASHVHASGQTEVAGTGNRQWQRTIVRGDTPGAAPAETVDLGFSAYAAAPSTTAFTLLDDRTYSVQVALSAVRTSGAAGEGRAIVVHGFVRRTGGAVNVVAQHVVSHIGDPGCCLYDVDLIASGGTLLVQATTGAGNTHATRWVGSVEWEEVRYA